MKSYFDLFYFETTEYSKKAPIVFFKPAWLLKPVRFDSGVVMKAGSRFNFIYFDMGQRRFTFELGAYAANVSQDSLTAQIGSKSEL